MSHISTLPRHKATCRKCKKPFLHHFKAFGVWEKCSTVAASPNIFPYGSISVSSINFFPDVVAYPGQAVTGPTVPTMQDTSSTFWRRFNLVGNGRTLLSWDPISLGTVVSTNRLRENFFFHQCCFLKLQQQMLHIVTAFRTKLSARLES